MYTTHKLITTTEYHYQHEKSTFAAELSPPLQVLLEALDAIQATSLWYVDDRPNMVPFMPLDVDYNSIRLQAMTFIIHLNRPKIRQKHAGTSSAPPLRLKSNLKGDAHWAPWWRSSILVQSSTHLPLSPMYEHDSYLPQDYLMYAITIGISTVISFLIASTNMLTHSHAAANASLASTP